MLLLSSMWFGWSATSILELMKTEACYLNCVIRKKDFCLGEIKGADQLRSNCEAGQPLCFRYTDSTIPLLLVAKIM